MKKLLAFLLSALLVLALCGCSSSGEVNTKGDETAEEVKDSGVNIFSKTTSKYFSAASDFSEGLAFVCIDGNREKTYCINKKGNIVFELDKNIAQNSHIHIEFHNGYTLIDGAVCDTAGKLTYPADVGASKFSLLAIEDGYIIAETTDNSFDSTDIKIGVMDTSFKWVVEPSSEIYNRFNGVDFNIVFNENGTSYYYKDTVFCSYGSDDSFNFNIKTGEIFETTTQPLPSEKWEVHSDGEYQNYDEKIMLSLKEKYDNICQATQFINGKAVIIFFNQTAGEYFFTIINEKGEFQFEPVKCGTVNNYPLASLDSQYVQFSYGTASLASSKYFDGKGNLIGEISSDMFTDKKWAYSYYLADGVITVNGGYNYSNKYYFYTPEGKPLFE